MFHLFIFFIRNVHFGYPLFWVSIVFSENEAKQKETKEETHPHDPKLWGSVVFNGKEWPLEEEVKRDSDGLSPPLFTRHVWWATPPLQMV